MPTPSDISNYHMQYLDVTSQHWHPQSESFAGADQFITALANGWEVRKCELVKHWYAAMRHVKVYEFSLERGEQTLTMPVVDNPYMSRFLEDEDIHVIEMESA